MPEEFLTGRDHVVFQVMLSLTVVSVGCNLVEKQDASLVYIKNLV